ncbi:PREDICTED: facilitated trehalose transporter Tret1-2 homolog isoform X1 [Nicrophorus vespilloides]|uniref:Facilitated trehalose transporter Tret1-2 homolog isoform X1 n=2 Tax=Nicrophorus vespilloides TaxID=110193 RepID=A0ABM1MPK3_NICVS|nr:PREDICTED: facilitated trehalose transporter Tret1-2 homolog isoform X1 [Nicrophorus vespilloides]
MKFGVAVMGLKERVQIWPQVLAIISATLVSFTCGIFFTWPSPSIPKLLNEEYPDEMTLDEVSYLTVFPALALLLSSPLSGRLIDLIGRRRTLLLITLPHLLSWGLTAIGGSIYIFYAARIINGFADSCTFAAVPTYISEVATPAVRSVWGNCLTFAIYFGNFIMNAIGAYYSIRTTATIFGIIPIMFFIIFYFMPETPYYLLMKGDEAEARKSLKWLRNKPDVEDELIQLTADVRRQLSEPGTYKHIFTIASNRRAMLTGIFIRGLQQYSGISAISMYSQMIFQKSGSDLSSSLSAIIFSGTMVITILASSFAIEILGRRISMMLSCLGSGIILILLAVYFYFNEKTDADLTDFQLFPIIAMIVYVLFYSIGLGIVPTIMLGEIFSSSIKARALCIMNVFFGIYISTSSKIFSYLMLTFGMYMPFALFGICTILGTICSYYYVPETRGKTLEQIQQSFKAKTKS